MDKVVKNRKSNFELLRIIIMIMIVFHHFYWSNFSFDHQNITFTQFLVQSFAMWGKVGVNCFILITGYFQCKSKIKVKKVLIMCAAVWFYSFVFLIIAYVIGINITWKQLIKAIFPIVFSEYWFITSYILLYLFSPFCNIIIERIDAKTYKILMIIMTIIFVFIPTFFYGDLPLSNLGWFIYMYFVGAFIRKNEVKFKNSFIILLKLIILIGISVISIYVLDKMQKYISINPLHFATPTNQLLPTFSSVCLFCLFMNLNFENKFINKISGATMGVYLIHSNYFMNIIIFQNILKVRNYENSSLLFIFDLASVIAIFIMCVFLDLIRQRTVELVCLKLINRILEIKVIKKLKNNLESITDNMENQKIKVGDIK